jgi:outer membrane protein
MKYISTIISVIALVAAGGVFFTQNREIAQLKRQVEGAKPAGGSGRGSNFKIAYFDLDTLQARYDYMKDVKSQAADRDNRITQELTGLDRKNQQQINDWRQKSSTMTQAEGEEAQRKYQEMQQEFAARKQELEQGLYKFEEEERNKIRKRIEDFVKEYNKDRDYSYIIAYDATSFIYNKDTLYNITNDLIEGLNAEYKKTK